MSTSVNAPPRWLTIIREVLALPTAPFAEQFVLDYVDSFCRGRRDTRVTSDNAGNLLVRIRRGKPPPSRPICLTAHLDHPGFVAEKPSRQGLVHAIWRGGVRPEYFAGSGVRFYVDGRWVRGKIRDVITRGRGTNKSVQRVRIQTADRADVPVGSIGMWNLPDPVIRGKRVSARACDDLAGVAAILCCIDRLSRSSGRVDACFLFTRAEEVGFVGALAACKHKTIPRRCLVVAVENSSEIPGVRMGDGPVLRVGDKASIFTPHVTAYCGAIAQTLVGRGGFQYQRKLMDGGTCESSAYCQRGYDATGICIALGNYHNMNRKNKTIASEYVHLDDLINMAVWFVELCRPKKSIGKDAGLNTRLDRLEKSYARLLYSTVQQPSQGG